MEARMSRYGRRQEALGAEAERHGEGTGGRQRRSGLLPAVRATWSSPWGWLRRGMGPALLAAVLLPSTLTGGRPALADPDWLTLAPGLAYRDLKPKGPLGIAVRLHVFKVDLRYYDLRIADARRREGRKVATVEELATESDAHLALNGTFFDPSLRPLGLLISGGEELNPLRRADWGVFFIKDEKAGLVHSRAWRKAPVPDVDFAIQVGPRLVVQGKPLKLKAQVARRAALGILPSGEVVAVVSRGAPVESNLLARTMAAPRSKGGLGCTHALMMDGGPSAQLFAKVGDFELLVPGGWGVPNAVVFVPKAVDR